MIMTIYNRPYLDDFSSIWNEKNLFSCLVILQHPLVNDVNIIHFWPDESSHPSVSSTFEWLWSFLFGKHHPKLDDSSIHFWMALTGNQISLPMPTKPTIALPKTFHKCKERGCTNARKGDVPTWQPQDMWWPRCLQTPIEAIQHLTPCRGLLLA